MKYCKASLFTLMFVFLLSADSSSPDATLVIDRFEPSHTQHGSFPETWQTRRNQERVYTVHCPEDTNCVLRAVSDDDNLSIGKAVEFDPSRFRYFSWRWNVRSLPPGASELSKDTNDSAAGVFVLFDVLGPMPRMIKYVWSSTLEPGTVLQSPSNRYVKMIILQSGTDHLGTWVEEQRDIVDDYTLCFGKKLPPVVGIGVLTDSDDTHSEVEAWYDDFVVSIHQDLVDSY